MSRRTAGLTALAATLVVGGFVPALLGGASAAGGCPAWTDPANDASTAGLPNPTGDIGDKNLDIVASTLTTTADSVIATIKVMQLNASTSDYGDSYKMYFTVNGKNMYLYTKRSLSLPGAGTLPTGTGAGIYNSTASTDAVGKAKSTYDVAKSTVTITATLADLAAAAAVAVADKPMTAIKSTTSNQLTVAGSTTGALYDDSLTTLTATMGVDCAGGGGPAPTPTSTPSASPSPTPSPTGGPAPEGFPKTGCSTFTDGKGDGTPVVAGPAVAPNEPDLDLTAVAVQTKSDVIKAFLKVDKLGDLPANFQGDRFEFEFLVGTKKFTFAGGRLSAAAATVTTDPNRGQLNGTTNADLKPKQTFDKTNNTVILEIDRAKLEKVNGAPVSDGTVVTGVIARTVGLQPGLQFQADSAQAATAADQVYTVGVSPCFGPPPAVLANTGALTSQYGDAAKVAAKLTSSTGAALAGKSVTFGLAGKAVVATTNAAGVASASIPLTVTAGTQTLSIAFAGDATADKVSMTTPFTVVQEKTKLILAITKKGTARTIVATLLDDDNKPVAGQRLVFAVNGKTVATLTTSSAGKATFTKANPSQTVKVTFAAVTGKWLGTTAQVKV